MWAGIVRANQGSWARPGREERRVKLLLDRRVAKLASQTVAQLTRRLVRQSVSQLPRANRQRTTSNPNIHKAKPKRLEARRLKRRFPRLSPGPKRAEQVEVNRAKHTSRRKLISKI